MVFACQNGCLARVLLDNGIGAVPANVVMRPNLALAVFNQKERIASLCYSHKVANVRKSQYMGNEQPLLGKDGSPLQLIHSRGRVPCCR